MEESDLSQPPSPNNPPIRVPVYCSCCGTQILAMRVGNTLVVRQKRHGRVHTAVVGVG